MSVLKGHCDVLTMPIIQNSSNWVLDADACLCFGLQDRDGEGATGLHLAARFGHAEAVQWLLFEGGSTEAQTHCGARPVHYAAASGDLTSLKLLMSSSPR